jgi:hypothetical protein
MKTNWHLQPTADFDKILQRIDKIKKVRSSDEHVFFGRENPNHP